MGKPQLDKHFSRQRPIMNIKKVNAHYRPLRMTGIRLCPLTPGGWQWRQLLRGQNGELPVGISAGETATAAFYRAQVANQPGLEIDASSFPDDADGSANQCDIVERLYEGP